VVLIRAGEEARGVEKPSGVRFARCRLSRGAHRNLAVTLDRQGRVTEAARHYRAFLAGARRTIPTRDHPARLEEMSAGRPAQ